MKIKLEDICEILNGYAFKSNQYVNEGFRIIRITNVQKGYVEDNNPVFYPIDNCEAKKYILNEDDLLISLTGNVGRVALLNKKYLPAVLNQRVACLRVKNNANIDKIFLFNFLNSDYFERKCIESAKGIAQKNMSTEWLKRYEIPFFSIEEQQKIAAVLDKVSKLIALRKKQLEKLDELVKSRFVEIFGASEYNTKNFPVFKLSKLCKVGSSKRIYQNEQSITGIPFLRISNLNDRIDRSIETSELFIPFEKYIKLQEEGLIPASGDILVTSRGTLGKCYIVKETDNFYFQDGMISWLSEMDESVTSLYITYLFSMSGIQKQIASFQAGSTVAYLSIAMLKKLDIMLPPLELQNQFATFAQQVDKQKSSIQQSLDKLEVLKKALMQEYFG